MLPKTNAVEVEIMCPQQDLIYGNPPVTWC